MQVSSELEGTVEDIVADIQYLSFFLNPVHAGFWQERHNHAYFGAYHDVTCIGIAVENTFCKKVGCMIEADTYAVLGTFPVMCPYGRHRSSGWTVTVNFVRRFGFPVMDFMRRFGLLVVRFLCFVAFRIFISYGSWIRGLDTHRTGRQVAERKRSCQ